MMRPSSVALTISLLLMGASSRAFGVVISEIHYHPPGGDESLEFIEISNDSSTPEDISGYAFTDGIGFQFPKGTILKGGAVLVVSTDLSAFKARYNIENVMGNFSGRLDAAGERITLVNHAGMVVQSFRYRDDRKWPAGPDGTGHTLSLRNLHLDPGEPESWAQSAELGGTPGRLNFPEQKVAFRDQVVIAPGETWRFAKGTQPFSSPTAAWRDPGFDDSGWLEGPSGFGFGDNDDRTVLSDMQNTYTAVACRKRFTLTPAQLEEPGDFYLGVNYDDGFCAYLNGAEAARANCGAAGEELAWDGIATGSREAGNEDAFRIPRNLFRAGENVLAVVGYNFSLGSSDFSLIPRLLLREVLEDSRGAALWPVFLNELYRGATGGEGWIEIFNAGAAPLDLSRHRLTDDPDRPDPYSFPDGTTIPPRGFLLVHEGPSRLTLSASRVRLFLLSPEGLALTASVFDRLPPPGQAGSYSEVRFPDGGPLEWLSGTPTPGAANSVVPPPDIVINEIFYHPSEERSGEFVEIYNPGGQAIDISGFSFDRGIDWKFPEGTVLVPGGYLVVAEDPALLREKYGLEGAQGPYTGRLADDGENVRLVDRWGNPVDEVRYSEGGAWSHWADGRGSSLELIDPRQDNSLGASWEASDETAKANWEKLTISVPNYVASGQSELHLLLVERGVCHIDDVSITRAGGPNLIPNPGFETATTPWIIQGTHVGSRRITTDQHSGSACLELNVSGKGDTLVNRIEIETAPRMTAGPYEVSLWARWQRGGSVLVVHGEYTAGAYGGRPSPAINLSGNSISAGLRLTVPWNLGTPGSENSARIQLRERSGSDNLGPLIAEVAHRPVSPGTSQPAAVTARVADSDGVAEVRVHYREGSVAGAFLSAVLLDDGQHGDKEAGDGLYGGEIPAYANLTRIVFYIEAVDLRNVSRRFPLEAPAKTCLYQVQGPLQGTLDAGRIVLDTQRTSELQSRPLHSNELVPGTFVFNDEEVYYQVGVRYRGSPWGRPGRNNYRIRFQADKPFHRGRKAVNLDNSGNGPNEGAAYFLNVRNSGPDTPAPAGEYGYLRTWLNGAAVGIHGLLQPVDRDFMTAWYGDPDRAAVLKVEGRRQFTDGGDLAGMWDGASFIYRTQNKENYRGYFIPGIRRSVDDWSSLIALSKVMDRVATPNPVFDETIDTVLDVEVFLRVLAPRVLQSDWDAFCVGNGHNGFLVLDPRDERWEVLPFDMDNTFSNPAPNLFPNSDPDVARLLSRPWPRRLYFRILHEYLAGYWSSANAGPYLDAVQQATGISTGGIKSYLNQSGAAARAAIRSSTTVVFRIVTNSGNDISTDSGPIVLEGEAPVQVATLAFSTLGGDVEFMEPTWTSVTRWRHSFELVEGENAFTFFGFDSAGGLVGKANLTVRVDSGPSPTVTSLSPPSGPGAGGTLVTFQGSGFAAGMRILFGGVEALQVTVTGDSTATAVTPPAPSPLPADGKVDVELVVSATTRLTLPGAFTYIVEKQFLRGDSNGDSTIDLVDPIATLFYLYHDIRLPCLDAADFNDSGGVGLNDATLTLDYLFRSGPPPALPFPTPGEDLTEDAFRCS